MDISGSYRLLELKSTATLDEVKAAYRRLARRWHPDVNPDNQQAQETFIQITKAYQTLLRVVPGKKPVGAAAATGAAPAQSANATAEVKVSVKRSQPATPAQSSPGPAANTGAPEPAPGPEAARSQAAPTSPAEPPLSLADEQMKRSSFGQLQDLLKNQRLPRAIALVEALGQRLPQDREVRQWQAIVYQRRARQLIRDRKFNQARAYLKKALSTDPHNRSLWAEVERDFRQLEQVY